MISCDICLYPTHLVWSSLGPSMLLKIALFHSSLWLILHRVYIPYPLYPVLCRWTFRLLPCLGYCKQLLQWTLGCKYLLIRVFILSGYKWHYTLNKRGFQIVLTAESLSLLPVWKWTELHPIYSYLLPSKPLNFLRGDSSEPRTLLPFYPKTRYSFF